VTRPTLDSSKQTILGGKNDLTFPWNRFWTPTNSPIHLGASSFWGGETAGFLADPEDGFVGAEANKHLLTTEQLLVPQPGCFVLCGEPGMGKSRTLEAFFQANPNPRRLILEFRDIASWEQFCEQIKATALWRSWITGNHLLTLVVDGVDEGLIKIDGFIGALNGMLKLEPVFRLQLVLACRSMEWPQSEGHRLASLWKSEEEVSGPPSSGIYELCPLRDRDARLAASMALGDIEASGSDYKFMRELNRHHLTALASRPLTLKMLLQDFVSGAGNFPRSHRELYQRCTQNLVKEHDAGRRARLRNKNIPRLSISDKQRERVAGRIAALMLLCGRSAVNLDPEIGPTTNDLTLNELIHGQDRLGEVPFEVTPALIEAVLETPLFWPKTAGRVGFYHQTLAESLAAEYLVRLPFPQVRSLLFQRDMHGEHVYPQLGELAAWMTCESEPLLKHLLAHDPEVLLRSDVTGIHDANKAALVDAILNKARAQELFDGAGADRFFHTLRHPGLARQLRQTLHDRTANQVARRMALDIAEACRLEEMLTDAIRLLRDAQETNLHRPAAAALDELATPQTALRLVPLLSHPNLSPADRLHVLHALLKHEVWSLSDALSHVANALSEDSTSGIILAQHAKLEDAEALLRACLKWQDCFGSLSRFRPFSRRAHALGVARIQEPRIRLLLAKVWWRARRQHQHEDFCGRDYLENKDTPSLPDMIQRDAELRHRFVMDLVSVAKGDAEERLWTIVELVQPEDFRVLIERASVGSLRRRKAYAKIAAHCFGQASEATRSSLLFDFLQDSRELREAFPWMRPWVLGAADSLEAAKQYRETEKWRSDVDIRRIKKPNTPPEVVWRRDLSCLGKHRPAKDWMNLAHNLFYRIDPIRADDEEKHDLTTSPGWKFHNASTHKRIIAGARRLIKEVPGNPQHRMGGQSEFDSLAYKALFLLRHEIEQDPQLAKAARQHWLPSIFDEFSNSDAHHLEMMALAYRLDPDRMCYFLRDYIQRCSVKSEGHCFALREFTTCWDTKLAETTIQCLTRDVRNPATIRDLMDFLAEHDAPAAIHAWRQLCRLHRRSPKTDCFVAATAALAGKRLFTFWEEIWPALTRDRGLARRVFIGFEANGRRGISYEISPMSEWRLAELYLYLLELFPREEDTPIPVGRGYTPTSKMETERLRDGLPAILASKGTPEAVAELERIAQHVPEQDALWIRWRKRDALVTLRRSTWLRPSPESVLSLTERAERRWITDEDDLLALVLESLTRLETNLQRSPNSWRDHFWQRTGSVKANARLRSVDEVTMSKRVAQWLQVDLAPDRGLSVLRELQIQHDKRTDIEVSAVATGANARHQRPIQVVVEVKGFWHTKIKTAHRDQLVADYLRGCGRTHGIYLIMWTKSKFDTRKSKLAAKTIDDARVELEKLTACFDGKRSPEQVKSMVLDVRPVA
jgi:hypothetical protein